MPQAQTGKKKSMPKVVRVNASDGDALLYKNLGNGRRIPFLWGTTVTLASGTTEVTVSSGVEFSEFKVCDGTVIHSAAYTVISGGTTPSIASAVTYIEKDTTNNIVKLKSTAVDNNADVDYDIMVFLGDATTLSSTDSNQIWK